MAKLYGLYDRDDALAHNSTVDDLPGIFHLVTVGSLIAFGVGRLTGIYDDGIEPPLVFWTLAMVLIPSAASGCGQHAGASTGWPRTR